MKNLTLGLLLISSVSQAKEDKVLHMAKANGFKPSQQVVKAIVHAAKTYGISARELTAIAIVETGLGKYTRQEPNKDGTMDVGLFQINEVNHSKCVEYNLESPEGSALCAAKLLSEIKKKHSDYLVRYHSKTLKHKIKYGRKIAGVYRKASK